MRRSLQAAGFAEKNLNQIAKQSGAVKALTTLATQLPQLQKNGITPEHMVKIASNDGAAQAIRTWVSHHATLSARGLAPSDMAALSGFESGRMTLEAAANQPWPAHMTPAELVSIAARKGGWKNLAWFLQHHKSLEESGMTREDVLKLAAGTDMTRAKALRGEGLGAKRPAAASQPTAKRARTMQANIKTEPATTAITPQTGWVTEAINTAQTRYIPTTRHIMIDLTDEGAPKVGTFTRMHTDEAMLVTGNQHHDSALDRMFPIRDPRNPARVHPDYADAHDATRCAENVRLDEVRLYKRGGAYSEAALWKKAKSSTPGTLFNSQDEFIQALKASLQAEMQALIRGGTPPSARQVSIRKVTRPEECDHASEARQLIGQYGAFPSSDAPADQPLLAHAQVAGLFAGAKLASDEDTAAYFNTFGELLGQQAMHDYAASVKPIGKRDSIEWAPFGGGNMAQYFNSSFKLHHGALVGDPENTNCFFVPVTFSLLDKNGTPKTETMMVVFQHKPVAPGKQFKLDYGPAYTLPTAPATAPSAPIKMEADR